MAYASGSQPGCLELI